MQIYKDKIIYIYLFGKRCVMQNLVMPLGEALFSITRAFWESEVSVCVPFSQSVVFLETKDEVGLGIFRAPEALRYFVRN